MIQKILAYILIIFFIVVTVMVFFKKDMKKVTSPLETKPVETVPFYPDYEGKG